MCAAMTMPTDKPQATAPAGTLPYSRIQEILDRFWRDDAYDIEDAELDILEAARAAQPAASADTAEMRRLASECDSRAIRRLKTHEEAGLDAAQLNIARDALRIAADALDGHERDWRAVYEAIGLDYDTVNDAKTVADRIVALVKAEKALRDWADCALYDATMEGPKLKGWNRSALDRCLREYMEAALFPTGQAASTKEE